MRRDPDAEQEIPFMCFYLLCSLLAGSVGRNLANKPNVYVSSSAGARWKEVSTEGGADDETRTGGSFL